MGVDDAMTLADVAKQLADQNELLKAEVSELRGENKTIKEKKSDILAIKNTKERQKAIAEHIDLFKGGK